MNKTIYLCGSMSHLKGFGLEWRKNITQWFATRGAKCYDPCIEETDEHKAYNIPKDKRQCWEEFPQELQEAILRKDLEQIEHHTSYIVCFFTRFSTGTVSELAFALYHNIPVYFVTTRRLVGWPFTVAHAAGNKIFRNFKALKKYLARTRYAKPRKKKRNPSKRK